LQIRLFPLVYAKKSEAAGTTDQARTSVKGIASTALVVSSHIDLTVERIDVASDMWGDEVLE
jgi:hypothetical protein